jgi:hypothetical protein
MNQLYFKNFFYGSVISLLTFVSGNIFAQHPSTSTHGDRYDLVANINKVHIDKKNIENLKNLIAISKDANNKKALKVHRDKLILEKKHLKKDYAYAQEEEANYKKNKSERIKQLEAELKASNEHYENLRSKIKNDLAKKNDFALQKDAADLLKSVQVKNDAYTKLSMEKAELLATVDAIDDAWKKVKREGKGDPVNFKSQSPDTNLTTK